MKLIGKLFDLRTGIPAINNGCGIGVAEEIIGKPCEPNVPVIGAIENFPATRQ